MKLVAKTAFVSALALFFQAGTANAIIVGYVVPLSGAQEVGVGDPDGSGTATLTLDTDANTISWSIVVADIGAVSLDHIHQAPAGANGGVVIDFSATLVGGPLVDTDVDAVVADPTGYYVNVHTAAFPGGAIRGQIPEPGTLSLFGLGLLGLAAASRRRVG